MLGQKGQEADCRCRQKPDCAVAGSLNLSPGEREVLECLKQESTMVNVSSLGAYSPLFLLNFFGNKRTRWYLEKNCEINPN